MNTKLKIAAGVIAGVIAGTTLLGSAFAAPQAGFLPRYGSFTMMRSTLTTDTRGLPTVIEMQSFMNRYRDAAGRIDMYRMHTDVISGRITPPRHVRPQSPAGRPTQSPAGRPTRSPGTDASPRGYGMMGARSVPAQTPGYGMMGNSY